MTAKTKPSKNGRAHERNGHAPASRLAGVVPPLDAVSTASEPKPAVQDGRTTKGTFAPGNTFARGNPNARKMAALRAALLECATVERMKSLGEKLYAAALDGDWIAAKLLLTYAIGKAPEAVDADQLDLDEWRILDAAPTVYQFVRLTQDGIDPKDAIQQYHKRSPQGEETFGDKFARLLKGIREAMAAGQRPTADCLIEAERQAHVGR